MANSSETALAPVSGEMSGINALMFRKLLPLLIGVYILSFLDRTNIALAKSALQADIGISAAAYGLGAGLFFLVYAFCEVPSNLALQKFGARLWITRIMVSWGLISMAMAMIHGPVSFYLLRILLGIAEAGLFPGVLLYLTYWFGVRDRARAIGYFLLGACFANIIGGPLGGFLMQLDGALGLKGWQWLFLLEGAPAVLSAALVWTKLPDNPLMASWLTRDQAELVTGQLRQERAMADQNRSLQRVFLHPQILLAIFIYFCQQIAVYAVTFFLPGIIRSWGGLSDLSIDFLNSLPWITAALGVAFLPKLAAAKGWSRRLMIGGLFAMALALPGTVLFGPVGALASVCVTTFFIFPVQSVLYTYPSARFQGAARAAGLGYVNSLGILGGFVGPSVMGMVEQQTGHASNGLLLIAGALVVAGLAAFWLRHPHQDSPEALAAPY